MTIEEVREYQQVRTPDYAALASYVNRAKGPDRTMAQFADDTGIGASTLSRIVNHNIKKPLSVDMIIKIFEKRFNPEDDHLLDLMARANGLFPKGYAEKSRERDSLYARRNEAINRERMMKNALIADVLASGAPVEQVYSEAAIRNMNCHTLVTLRRGNFMLQLGSRSNNSPIRNWEFFLFTDIIDEIDRVPCIHPRYRIQRIMERLSPIFLTDAWTPENLHGYKLSFAFLDIKLFEAFKEQVQPARLHNEMTILLLDPNSYSVISEVWISGDYGQLTNISIFEALPPVVNEDNPDDYETYQIEETEDNE